MLPARAQDFIRMEGLVCQLRVLFVSLERLLANHIGDEIVHKFGLRLSLCLLSNSDCNVWKTLNV
jgi:hypothetical protein